MCWGHLDSLGLPFSYTLDHAIMLSKVLCCLLWSLFLVGSTNGLNPANAVAENIAKPFAALTNAPILPTITSFVSQQLPPFLWSALAYSVYSVVVEKLVAKRFRILQEQTQQQPLLPLTQQQSPTEGDASPSPTALPSVAKLRKTISRFSHVVETPSGHALWKQWALTSSTTRSSVPPLGKSYQFAYRSYINDEERSAMLAPFWSFHRFNINGFYSRKVGTLHIEVATGQASITDYFWKSLIQPVTITWFGQLEENPQGQLRIVWTSSEMNMAGTVVPNPPPAERLRQIPWDIVKEEEGMILFQRGDLGVLAYDCIE